MEKESWRRSRRKIKENHGNQTIETWRLDIKEWNWITDKWKDLKKNWGEEQKDTIKDWRKGFRKYVEK